MEHQKHSGVWWRPNNPDQQLSGELTFSDEGLRLDLVGSFASWGPLSPEEERSYPLLLGHTTTGERVTLAEVMDGGGSIGSGVPTQRLMPRLCFVGVGIEQPEHLVWDSVEVRFQHLLEWFGQTGLSESPEIDADGHLVRYGLNYGYPESLTAELSDATIELRPNLSVEGPFFRGRTLEPSVSFRVRVTSPLSLDDLLLRFIQPLQNLVTLATDARCLATTITVTTTAIRHGEDGPPVEAHALFNSARAGRGDDDVLFPQQMVFTAPPGAQFESMVGKWIALSQQYHSVCSLVFGSVYFPAQDIGNQFFNAAQAAEAFHRVRFPPGLETTEEKHQDRTRSILDACPPELRKWLTRKLKYSNEVGLPERLRDLYGYAQPIIEPLVGKRTPFVEAVVGARNTFAHTGRLDVSSGEQLERLYKLTQALGFLIRACFLRELGYEADGLYEMFSRAPRYTYAIGGWAAPSQ